jgi:type IX secretion system PorP/SprF family membrane protein
MTSKFQYLKILTGFLAVFSVTAIYAQQDPQYTQFMYNKLPQNAGYTGAHEGLTFRAVYRDQWTRRKNNRLEGAPKTTTFSIHSPLKNEAFALGFFFVNDRLGLEHKNQFDVTYAYRLKIGKKIKLSMGINAGLLWYQLNADDAILTSNADLAFMQNISRVLPDIGAGIYLSHPNFYIGASVPNVIKGELKNKGQEGSSAKRTPHLVFMAGGLIPVGKNVKLRPQMQYCYLASAVQKVPHTFDFNISLLLYDRFNIGAQYHTTFLNKNNGIKLTNPDSFDMMLEVWPVKQLMIGYSYDYTISRKSSYSNGSHEVMIGYELSLPKKRKEAPSYTQCYHF